MKVCLHEINKKDAVSIRLQEEETMKEKRVKEIRRVTGRCHWQNNLIC